MSQYLKFTNVRNATALLLIFLGSVLFLTGCAQLYKFFGFTDDQVQDQVDQDQAARKEIIEGIRLTTTELITTAIAAAGTIASGFLAKWLGTERKITAVMIAAIEKADNPTTKEIITTKAISAGVESKLNARVRALT